MNVKIDSLIRESVAVCKERGIKILRGGPWIIFNGQDNSEVSAVDPIMAVLLVQGKLTTPYTLDQLSSSGWIREACLLLGVDMSWLYRFWMGYDRAYQVVFLDKDNKEIGKDDVSKYGIQLSKEFYEVP